MDPLSEKIRKMIASKQLKISMSEVARVTGVSTSQLRYWEKKGYIKSEQDEQIWALWRRPATTWP